ncbi:MAG: hypothetical protein ACJA1A_000893 [Saprospiraceae bacterium]|jgi:hypothetical protein
MISSIRTWLFNKSLRGHQNFTHPLGYSGINMCKSICIVANGSDDSSKSATENYKSKLESHNKSVDILYFIDNKSETEIGYSRQAIKWNGVPQNEIIDSILSKKYDLLIFLYPIMEDHLRYLAILCNAKFKIGPGFQEHNHIFDLMVDITDYSDTKSLIKNIDNQLRQLST